MIPSVNFRKRRLLEYLDSQQNLRDEPNWTSSWTQHMIDENERRLNQSIEIFDSILENITATRNESECPSRKRKLENNSETFATVKVSKGLYDDSPSTSRGIQQNQTQNKVGTKLVLCFRSNRYKYVIEQTPIVPFPTYTKIDLCEIANIPNGKLVTEVYARNTRSKVNDIIYLQSSMMKRITPEAKLAAIRAKCVEQIIQNRKQLKEKNNHL